MYTYKNVCKNKHRKKKLFTLDKAVHFCFLNSWLLTVIFDRVKQQVQNLDDHMHITVLELKSRFSFIVEGQKYFKTSC